MRKDMARRMFGAASVVIALLCPQGTFAQTPPPVGEAVKGPQLQAWLDQKFTYAGVHQQSGCFIMNTGVANGRVLFIRCPNGWAEKLTGTAKVIDDTLCTSFPIPNTPPGDDCVSWHSAGGWKFEQRKGATLDTTVVLLPAGLTGAK
jgi:hypothetical protein